LKSRLCNGVQRNDAKTGKIALNCILEAAMRRCVSWPDRLSSKKAAPQAN